MSLLPVYLFKYGLDDLPAECIPDVEHEIVGNSAGFRHQARKGTGLTIKGDDGNNVFAVVDGFAIFSQNRRRCWRSSAPSETQRAARNPVDGMAISSGIRGARLHSGDQRRRRYRPRPLPPQSGTWPTGSTAEAGGETLAAVAAPAFNGCRLHGVVGFVGG